jgi:hypothetical protein
MEQAEDKIIDTWPFYETAGDHREDVMALRKTKPAAKPKPEEKNPTALAVLAIAKSPTDARQKIDRIIALLER